MFTGIIEHQALIEAVHPLSEKSLRLTIATQFPELALGESVAVDGVCLTVTRFDGGTFDCDVSPETLDRSHIGSYRSGTKVNVERSLRMGDRMGGHWVMGHVDSTGTVLEKTSAFDFVSYSIGFPRQFRELLLPKGSVAVNGVSLTVNKVTSESFQVMLIPHTLEKTNLAALEVGSWVNLEFDWMSKLILEQIKQRQMLDNEEARQT